MSQKNQKGAGSKIIRMLMLIPAIMSLIGNLFSMMRAELALMRKKLMVLIVLALFGAVLILSIWLCVNALLFSYLSLHLSVPVTLVLILSLNFLLFVIVCLLIVVLNIDLSFPETRKAVKDVISR